MKNEFTLSETFNCGAEAIYTAWLSSEGHANLTGGPAKVDGRAGGKFSAWDGYIWGTFAALEKNKRISQTWRTSEFPADAADSLVDISLGEQNGKTVLTLTHTNIPDGQADDYKQGWEDFYFKPMRQYFG